MEENGLLQSETERSLGLEAQGSDGRGDEEIPVPVQSGQRDQIRKPRIRQSDIGSRLYCCNNLAISRCNVLQEMLRIAIVGCGKVADQHVEAIHRVRDC